MTTFKTSLSILSFKNDIIINSINVDSLMLTCNIINSSELYNAEKQTYNRSRLLQLKQNQKIKDNLKELQQLFLNQRYICLQWGIEEPLLLFFNSGTIVNVKLDKGKSAVQKIKIDNSLCGKLTSDNITDVAFCENWLLISYSEPKLSYIFYGKQLPSFSNKLRGNKKNKLLGFSPHINTIDLPGPCNKRLEKKLSVNNLKDCVLIWWQFSNDVWPWMPANYNVNRISFLVYLLKGSDVNILCSTKVHGELQHARFSRWHSNHILTIEELKEKDNYNVSICTYEIAHGRCQCISLLKLSLNSHITAFDYTCSEDKVLLSGEDMSLLVYDLTTNTTLVTSTLFIVKEITCDSSGSIACIIGTNGLLQCFDIALTQLNFQICSDNLISIDAIDLYKIVHPCVVVQKILWKNSNQNYSTTVTSCEDVSDSFLMCFEAGIFVFVNFSTGCIAKNNLKPLKLLSQYLKNNCVNESICLVQCLNWCLESELCFQCVSKVSNFLLRRPLTEITESAIQLCLGTFYDAISVLPESVLLNYQQQIDQIARRFFHHLLRYYRFEKAYLLAVNLQSRDLFLDLHHAAKGSKQSMLALIAFKHAEQLYSSESYPSNQSDSSNEAHKDFNPVSSKELKLDHVEDLSSNSKLLSSYLESCYKTQNTVTNSLSERCVIPHYTEEIRSNFCEEKSSNCENVSLMYDFLKLPENVSSTDSAQLTLEGELLDIFKDYTKSKDQKSSCEKLSLWTPINIIKQDKPFQINYNKMCLPCTKSKPVFSQNTQTEKIEDTHIKFEHFGIV